jgi:serine/threonine protein kinase
MKSVVEMKPLASGTFGPISQASYFTMKVAVKEFRLDGISSNLHSIERSAIELSRSIIQIRHPYLVHSFGISLGAFRIWMIYEFVDGDSLRTILSNASVNIGEATMWRWSYEIAIAMEFLHRNKIVHGDLRAANVLLDSQNRCKLINYNSFRMKHELYKAFPHKAVDLSVEWHAPEIVSFAQMPRFSFTSDVFAFGTTLWEIGTRREPFEKANRNLALIRIFKQQRVNDPLPDAPAWLKSLIAACWQIEPIQRPNAAAVVTMLQNEAK